MKRRITPFVATDASAALWIAPAPRAETAVDRTCAARSLGVGVAKIEASKAGAPVPKRRFVACAYAYAYAAVCDFARDGRRSGAGAPLDFVVAGDAAEAIVGADRIDRADSMPSLGVFDKSVADHAGELAGMIRLRRRLIVHEPRSCAAPNAARARPEVKPKGKSMLKTLSIGLFALLVAAPAFAAGDAAKGEKVFRKCKACHAVGDGAKNKVGPVLNGVIGAPAGENADFKYSKALQAAAADGLVWDEAAMTAYLTKPKDFIEGTKMSFAGLRKERDVIDVIAYLETFD